MPTLDVFAVDLQLPVDTSVRVVIRTTDLPPGQNPRLWIHAIHEQFDQAHVLAAGERYLALTFVVSTPTEDVGRALDIVARITGCEVVVHQVCPTRLSHVMLAEPASDRGGRVRPGWLREALATAFDHMLPQPQPA